MLDKMEELLETLMLYRRLPADALDGLIYGRSWLAVGTSQRISPDDLAQFRNLIARAHAAEKISEWINEFTTRSSDVV